MAGKSVMGIDTSTKSLAYCIYSPEGKPVEWGEVFFEGERVFERLADGRNRVESVFKHRPPVDAIYFESSVFVQNKKIVILMAMALGAIMSTLVKEGTFVDDVTPPTWQNFISNRVFTKAEKDQLKKEYPDKSDSWRQNKMREIRKERTRQWAIDKFGIAVDSDNVSDAIAIGYYGWCKVNGSA